jgi:cellulose synthase (UDP-forming)
LGPIIALSLISFGALALSQLRFASIGPAVWWCYAALGFTTLYYLVSLRVNAFTRDFDYAGHQRLVNDWNPDSYPTLDILLPSAGEDLAVLRNAWGYIAQIDYPRERMAVLCLDDSDREEVRQMATEFGFTYLCRPNRGWFKKAGNLQYGYANSHGDYVMVFDADFCPRPDIVREMMPYFDQDPRLGIVQSPQYFRVTAGQSWIERGAGAVQEFFYRVVQTSRQQRDGAICVGTNSLFRRAALDSNGGTTLIGHSEDVHTGFDLRRHGWGLKYIPINLATGLCPDDLNSFVRQQYRWCMGSMSLLGSHKFWATKLALRSRLCYLSGFFYYLHTALFAILSPLVPIMLMAMYPQEVKLHNYILIAPSALYTLIVLPLWHRCSYRLEAWTIKYLYSWAHAAAILDIIRRRPMGWDATGATTTGRTSSRRRVRTIIWIATLWGLLTGTIWVGLATFYAATWNVADFIFPLLSGAFYLTIVLRIVIPTCAIRAI